MGEGEETVVITVDDLVEHTVLSRKLSETRYKRDYLVRNGAMAEDLHVNSLTKAMGEVEAKLAPIKSKLSKVDLVTIVPRAAELNALNEQIGGHGIEQIDQAISSKSGELYELLKCRSEITRANFELRDEICRLTILLNSMPFADAESIKAYLEGTGGGDIDVSFLGIEKQHNLLALLSRLGKKSSIEGGMLKPAMAQGQQAGEFTVVEGKKVWLSGEKLAQFSENQKKLSELSQKIQLLNAERQVRLLSPDELLRYSSLQAAYADSLSLKKSLVQSSIVNEEKVAISVRQ